MHTIATPTMWALFAAFVIAALVVDLLVLRQNGPHKVSSREALLWSAAWIAVAMVFNLGLWWYLGERLPGADGPGVVRIGARVDLARTPR